MSQAKQLRALTEQHPESVAQLFTAYQVAAAPKYNNLMAAYKQHGAPFLADLNNVFGELSNYDGDGKPPMEKKSNGIIDGIKGMVHLIQDKERLKLYENGRLQNRPIIHLSNGQTVFADEYQVLPYASQLNMIPGGYQYPDSDYRGFRLPERILGMSKSLFLVLAGMLTVVIFMEMFQRKH